ncbi:MAG: FUSC family protein [Atopobiaceae bacterium]|nr:FUSC family protein [Atopobiaceae bacterium]MBQ9318006.1 FUSC family protein [Atopobiaceae bacterium]
MNTTSEKTSWKPTALDTRMAICILICCLVSTALTALDLKFPVGDMRLDVIQKMTACISCLLCCQDTADASRKAGAMRVLVTAVGGACGIAVVAADLALGSNPWLLAPLMAAGLVPTLCLCRLAGAPAFNARIGAISYLLVAATLSGPARLWYAVFRLLSTIFGAAVVWGVTVLMSGKGRP